jgi:PAS domain S-box-containing protein
MKDLDSHLKNLDTFPQNQWVSWLMNRNSQRWWLFSLVTLSAVGVLPLLFSSNYLSVILLLIETVLVVTMIIYSLRISKIQQEYFRRYISDPIQFLQESLDDNQLQLSLFPIANPKCVTFSLQHKIINLIQHFQSQIDSYRLISESTHDMLVHVETDGTIKFVNSLICNTLGFHESELLGQDIRKIFPESFDPLTDEFIYLEMTLRSQDTIKDYPFLLKQKNSEIIQVNTNAARWVSDSGEEGYLLTFSNRSEFHAAQIKLRRLEQYISASNLVRQAPPLPSPQHPIPTGGAVSPGLSGSTLTLPSSDPIQVRTQIPVHPRMQCYVESRTNRSLGGGGDWIRVISEPHQMIILACDCVRGGEDGALLTSYLQGVSYSLELKLGLDLLSPTQIIGHLQEACRMGAQGFHENDFHLVAIVIDFESNLIRVANQGYTFPLLLDRSGRWTALSHNQDIIHAKINVYESQLPEGGGASLILYSNGVLQHSGTHGETKYKNRHWLRNTLAQHASQDPQSICSEILGEEHNSTPTDDKVLFIGKFLGQVA